MKLPSVCEFLEDLPGARLSGTGDQITVPCFQCDGPSSSRPHLSIKLEIEPGEPMVYQCFRADCGIHGIFTTTELRKLGCIDPATIEELAKYNARVSPRSEKVFVAREGEDIAIANLPRGNAAAKLDYLRRRLGLNLSVDHLKDLKIQLSLLELLRVNDIRSLAVSEGRARLIDVYCIGFLSAWNDYVICRDITGDLKSGNRYYNYRIAARGDKNALKIYTIPRTVELLNPRACVINVAEGPFSILGAYLNTDLGAERPNNIWAANCGAQYESTILRLCKQYGFLKVRIHIWSDSEIKPKMYQDLHRSLKDRLDIRSFVVHYNRKAEDFGHAAKDIAVETITLC